MIILTDRVKALEDFGMEDFSDLTFENKDFDYMCLYIFFKTADFLIFF